MLRALPIALCALLAVSASEAEANSRVKVRTAQKAKVSKTNTRKPRLGLVGGFFRRAAKKKGDRVFHSAGKSYQARKRGADGKQRFGQVRLSRGGATKPGKPDILGLALKINYGKGAQDFTLISSRGTKGLSRFLPSFRSRFAGQSFSSILPVKYQGLRGTLVAQMPSTKQTLASRSAKPGERSFELELRPNLASRILKGAPRKLSLGNVTFDYGSPYKARADFHIDPTKNTAGGVKPAGLINRIRTFAYRGSRRGRGAE